MPVARIQLPDGRVARIEVPEGTTPEQVVDIATREAPKMGFGESFASRAGQYVTGVKQMAGMASPEELAQSQAKTESQSLGGQLAADMAVGVPLEMLARRAGPKAGPIIAGGVQAGMLPVSEGSSRSGNAAAGAATAAIIGGPVSRGVQTLVAPVRKKIGDALEPLVEKAQQKFGLKLLPGQKTGDIELRARETGFRQGASTQPRMFELAEQNQQSFNRALAREMGVPDATKITPKIEQQARNAVTAQETKALAGKTLTLDNAYINDVQSILQNISVPSTMLFGNKAQKILANAGRLGRIEGMDYKWLRSDLQSKARMLLNSDTPGSKDSGIALKELVKSLDSAVDRSAGQGGNFTKADLDMVQDARRKWKAILTVSESKRGNYDIDPNKWATKAKDWYRPGEDMHDLIEIVDNIPDIKSSIGVPASLAAPNSGISVAASPGMGGMQFFTHPLGFIKKPAQSAYMGLAETGYYTPAEMKRRALADALGASAGVTAREPQLDYVTRR